MHNFCRKDCAVDHLVSIWQTGYFLVITIYRGMKYLSKSDSKSGPECLSRELLSIKLAPEYLLVITIKAWTYSPSASSVCARCCLCQILLGRKKGNKMYQQSIREKDQGPEVGAKDPNWCRMSEKKWMCKSQRSKGFAEICKCWWCFLKTAITLRQFMTQSW